MTSLICFNDMRKTIVNNGKRIVLSVCLLAMTAVVGLAANPTAKSVLDKVEKALRTAPSLAFDLKVQNGRDAFTGNLGLRENKFVYGLGSLLVFYNGKTQWTVAADSREVSITEPTDEEIAETNPLAFVNNYAKNYNVSLVSQSNGTYTVKMVALKKSSYIRSAQIVISGSTWLPTHVTAQLSTGQTLTINVKATVLQNPIPNDEFNFKKSNFEGYEIIDLR